MRNLVIGICSLVFFLLVLMVGYTVTAREARTSELERALNVAMEQVMGQLNVPGEFAPESEKQLAELFEQLLLTQLSSRADYEIRILDIDLEKGLLSVEVEEHYTHINGREGSITAQKLILLDQIEGETEYKNVELTFLVSGEVYRRYELKGGSMMVIPQIPYLESGEFLGWRSALDGEIYDAEELKTMKLYDDITLEAAVRP